MAKIIGAVCLLFVAGLLAVLFFPSWEPPEEEVVRVATEGPYVITWDPGEEEAHPASEDEERYRDHPVPPVANSVTVARDGWTDGAVYVVYFEDGGHAGCGNTADDGDQGGDVLVFFEEAASGTMCSAYRVWTWLE